MIRGLIENYNYVVHDLADPRTKDWLTTRTPFLPVTVTALYLYLIYSWLPKFMEKRRPYSLKTILFLYNVFQIVACSTLTYFSLTSGKSNYWFGCYPTDYSENPLAFRILYCAWGTHILKLIDLSETVFFILRKKYRQVSNLHVYHHTASYFISWMGVKYIGGGSSAFPPVLNNIVHVIMYSYYLLSASGPKMQAKLATIKPIVTIIQMVQLSLILALGIMPLTPNCDLSILASWLFIPNVTIFLALFFNFFVKNYMGKRKEKI